MHGMVLLLHLLGATIWTGGHLVLGLSILPKALKENSVSRIQDFEQAYEKIGIPALIIQVLTGVWLAWRLIPQWSLWLQVDNPVVRLIWFKLLLLLITLLLAADARIRVIPTLSSKNLRQLAWHIIPVTLISVLFVVVGVSFRTGWWF
jgi:putative copper export protein